MFVPVTHAHSLPLVFCQKFQNLERNKAVLVVRPMACLPCVRVSMQSTGDLIAPRTKEERHVFVDPEIARHLKNMTEKIEFYRYYHGNHMALIFRSTDPARQSMAVKAHLLGWPGGDTWFMLIERTSWKPPSRNFLSSLIHGPKLSVGKWTWTSLSSYIIEFIASSNPHYNYLVNNCITFAMMLTGGMLYRRFHNKDGDENEQDDVEASTIELGRQRGVIVHFEVPCIDYGADGAGKKGK